MQSVQQLPAGVAAGHPASAGAGLAILQEGGTAADAVAAMILAACVAETIFTGLAGGGFATCYDAATGTITCLDFFVAVPGLDGTVAGPTRTISVAFGSVPVPYAMGGATVAVPGTPAGVAELNRRFGALPWHRIVQPALDLATAGAPFSAEHAELLPEIAPAMLSGAGNAVYTRPDGTASRLLQHGELLFHDGLADVLADLSAAGPDVLYTGRWGRELVAEARGDGGALSAQDMAAYRVAELRPERVPFGPGTVVVRGNDLDAFAGTVAALDVDAVRAGPADRALALVRALRSPSRRSETTAAAAVDRWGNACATAHSLGLGSGVWVSGVHGNSMLGEGELLRGELRPGSRMPSMMVPLVVTGPDGGLLLAAGAAGGSRIRPALLQVLGRVLLEGLPTADAVRAPRLSATPEVVHLEPGFGPEVTTALQAAGEELVHWPGPRPYFGGVAVVGPDGPAADPRRGGVALLLD